MKKILTLTALVLVIATSVISGTLAMYSITLDQMDSGTITAKEFKLVGEGDAQFSTPVKIAPTETVEKIFTITNAEGGIVTETNMKLDIGVTFNPVDGKGKIVPLTAKLYKVGTVDTLVGDIDADGVVLEDGFNIKATAQTNTYKVVVEWPSNSDPAIDIQYAGADFSSVLSINVTGTQVVDEEDLNIF